MAADKSNEVDLTGVQAAQAPRYRLTQQAYIDDKILEIGTEITYVQPPGWHMEPLNAAAEAMVKKHRPQPYNVVDELTRIGGGTRGA